ncbi:hypothetical protein [Ochrobactrum sp. A-1]|uniref:hypothetical protein n=1 Tax=Ochrobactrum sp. A-1 TaxID=2920940 RepID=UPI001F0AEB6E|nr:hypothetical protein [Ochrobactrum sp. A-1]
MKRFANWMTLACAALLAGCTATTNANDGAGYEMLRPSVATRTFILQHDRPFANEVAAHNVQCGKDRACRK